MKLRFVTNAGAAAAAFHDAVLEDLEASRLPGKYRAYYGFVRPILPLSLRQHLQGRRGARRRSRDFYPDRFMDRLNRALRADGGVEVIHPWPDGATFAFALTHDVESAEGLRRSLALADLEEEAGFRSSFNIVPHGYAIDQGIVRELQSRGFELGIHGFNHDGRLFVSKRRFDSRVGAVNDALRTYGAVGFRGPMAHRNLSWMQDLDIAYDGSCFDADPYQAMSGGVGSVWPFVAGGFVEMPYTLPQDHTVFIVLGEKDGAMWSDKLSYLRRCGGLVSMLTHPDYLDSSLRLGAYRAFLDEVKGQAGYFHALPRDVAAWWKARDASRIRKREDGSLEVDGPAREMNATVSRFQAGDPIPEFRSAEG